VKRATLLLLCLAVPAWPQANKVTVSGDGSATVVSIGTQGPAGGTVPAGGSEGTLAAKTGGGFGWTGVRADAVSLSLVSYPTLKFPYLPDQASFEGSIVFGTGGAHLARLPEGSEPNPLPQFNGQFDTFLGINAGDANTVGSFGTFVGNRAGMSNEDGDQNTFLGAHAGESNVHGYHDTYIGAGAGENALGHYNVFIGTDSGLLTTTGTENLFAGTGSGASTTTGTQDVYLGVSAGSRAGSAGTMSTNTAVGYNALGANGATADINGVIALGAYAGRWETGSYSFYVDSWPRTSESDGRTKSLLYGTIRESPASQTLDINAGAINANGTLKAPLFRTCNGVCDNTNYERGEALWSSDQFYIRNTKGGSGADRNMVLASTGNLLLSPAAGFYVTTNTRSLYTGHLYPATDATYVLGNLTTRWAYGAFGGSAGNTPVQIKLHASQTANAIEVQDSSANSLFAVTKDGIPKVGTSVGIGGAITVKGSDGNDCTLTFTGGILTAETCP
jgi:hypothetical protein